MKIFSAIGSFLKMLFMYSDWQAELEEIQQQEDMLRYKELIDDQTLSWIRLNRDQLTWLVANQDRLDALLQIQTPTAIRKMDEVAKVSAAMAAVDKAAEGVEGGRRNG